jgi:hypothetical protein
MDPFTLIGVAANLARVIIHLAYTYKLQATHVGILVDRITSLEKPLESMFLFFLILVLLNTIRSFFLIFLTKSSNDITTPPLSIIPQAPITLIYTI